MTVLYFSGGENSEWRKFLAEEGIDHVSMSYVKLASRVKFARPWTVADHFSPETHVLLDAGGYSFNKEDSGVTEEDAMDMANSYMAFVSENIDSVELVTEFDANILGRDWLEAMRTDFYNDLGDKFVPVWRPDSGREDLERLSARYDRVGILKAGLSSQSVPLLNGVVRQCGVKLHGLGIADWELVKAVKFDSVSSGSWINPSTYGETIVWTGHELKRYPAKYKSQARARHGGYLGSLKDDNDAPMFNVQLIIDDDRKELLRLAIWSWQQFMASLDRSRVLNPFGSSRVTPLAGDDPGENEEQGTDSVDPLTPGTRNERLLPAVPISRPRKVAPVLGIQTISSKDDDGEEVEERLMVSSAQSLLVCNSCEIRDMCPEFSPGSECAFDFPAYVSTKNQMRALQDWLITLQTQRVTRMSMMEQVKGGYADANLSAEEDRLQRMINAKREAEKQGFSLHIEASSPGEVGAISRIFGKDVGDASSALPAPIHVESVMKDSGIVEGNEPVEAEIVGEEE